MAVRVTKGKGGVTIPVGVEGADEAQRDLQEVKGSVEELGQAGQNQVKHSQGAGNALDEQGKKTKKVKKNTEDAAKAVDAFDDSAKAAAVGILGQINPALGSMGSLVVDVVKGIGNMSTAMLGMLGIGAVLAGIAAGFSAIAEKARLAAESVERHNAAEAEGRAGRRDDKLDIADELLKMGQDASRAKEVLARSRELVRETGVRDDWAQSTAIAAEAGFIDWKQRGQFLAGIAGHGGELPAFTGDPQANAAQATAYLESGAKPEVQAAYLGYLRGREPTPDEALDLAEERMRRSGYSDREAMIARSLYVRDRDPEEHIGAFGRTLKYIQHGQKPGPGRRSDAQRQEWMGDTPSGSSHTMGQLEEQYRRVLRDLGMSDVASADAVVGGPATSAPISVTKYETNINVASMYAQQEALGPPLVHDVESWGE